MLLGGVLLIQNSCYYDKEEILYPQNSICDTSNVTYSEVVSDIMATNCNSCHSSNNSQGGIITDNYNDLNIIANNNRLWGTINHQQGYQNMPQNRPKLPECELRRIKKWIDDGALNN